jgi:hypothetical protein
MKPNMSAPGKSRAQAMVEFAIVLPLLLLLLYGLLEAGRLLFIYSTIVTATRQAARYGSAIGEGTTPGVPRYQDCSGIRLAAQRVDFLDAFDDSDIVIEYDTGPGTSIDDTCDGTADNNVTPSPTNDSRILVTIAGNYFPIVPRIVPFLERSDTSARGPILATSARTIIVGISIEVTSPPGSGVPTAGTSPFVLTMTASPTTYGATGEVINFTYVLTNNHSADLSGITLIVTHGSWSCPGNTLAVGASMTCTGSYTITPGDVTAGSVPAQATASGSDGTNTITSTTGTATLTWVARPELTLVKTASVEYAPEGGTVVYTFTLTNSGNVPLTAPTISDPRIGVSLACGGDLAPLATGACTASYVVTADDVDDQQLVNSATASATYGTQTITSDPASVSVWTGPLFLRASASPTSLIEPGTITYTYELINNTGVILYPPYSISGHRGTENCSTTTTAIPILGSITCSGAYTVDRTTLEETPATSGEGLNAVLTNSNVRGTGCTSDNNCNGPRRVTSNADSVSVTLVRNPSLALAITSALPNPATTPGAVVTVTYTVTNTGNVRLSPTIADTKATGITCTPANPLGPGVSQTCTGTYSVTQLDIDEGSFTGQATANATFLGQPVSSVTQAYTIATFVGPRVRLQITPNPTSYNGIGQFIVYAYTLRNTGSVPLTGPYVITDSKVTNVDCTTATSPLQVGASTTCVGSYATTQADLDTGHIVNSASVSMPDGTQSNSAMAVVYVPGAPTLTPTATNTAPPTLTPTPSFTPTPTATTPVCNAAPVTLGAGADSWVDEANPSTPGTNGTSPTLTVRSRNNNDTRALVWFVLPSLPPGCKVESATLRLFINNPAGNRTLQVLRLDSAPSWTEAGVTWNNQPAPTGAAVSVAAGTTSGYRSWTVTSMVQAMYSGTNNGFLIRDSSENATGQGFTNQFNSRESGANTPQLEIIFSQAP